MQTLYARFNTGLLVFIALTGIVLVTMLATRAYGGPLDPPGAPAPTMKTLQQVEPRTPISQPASFPIQINAPGSYYFTENITGVISQHGIVINADNVTLDLGGFTLSGASPSVGLIGISDNNYRTNLTIRNGIVRAWGSGVYTPLSTRSTYEDLTVTDNLHEGVVIGSGNNVRRLTVWNNGFEGLQIQQVPGAWGSIIEDSNFSRNGRSGIRIVANNVWVHHNLIDANGTNGISIDTSIRTGAYNEITDNRITGNGGYGVDIPGNRNVVVRNVTDANTAGQLLDTGAGNIVGPLQQSPSTDPNANIGFP